MITQINIKDGKAQLSSSELEEIRDTLEAQVYEISKNIDELEGIKRTLEAGLDDINAILVTLWTTHE